MRTFFSVILGLLVGLAGCSSDEPAGCPSNGEAVESQVGRLCAYIVVVGGFECPPEYPHRFDYPTGEVICGERSIPADALPGDICSLVPMVCADREAGMPDGGIDATPDGTAPTPDASVGPCTGQPAGTVCRAAAGACDIAEVCDGSSDACPADSNSAAGTVCRAAASACDVAEVCDGASNACPADANAPVGTLCPGGTCDAAGMCMVSSCTAGMPCSTGNACELGEIDCSTGSPVCTAVGPAAAGTVCRAAAGVCDVGEVCDGASNTCPADLFVGPGTICRAAVDACDVPESCSGAAAACPADSLAPAGTLCPGGMCTGSSAACM